MAPAVACTRGGSEDASVAVAKGAVECLREVSTREQSERERVTSDEFKIKGTRINLINACQVLKLNHVLRGGPSPPLSPQMLLLSLLATATALQLATAKPPLTSFQFQKSIPSLPLGLFRHLHSLESAASPQELPLHADQLTFSVLSPASLYPAHTFDQLVSHDPAVPAPSEGATFEQRYWFDATYYRPGGPVILLDGGETDATGRLPFLKEGILQILSQATGGIG